MGKTAGATGSLQARQGDTGVGRVLQCFNACAPFGNWCSLVLYSAEI